LVRKQIKFYRNTAAAEEVVTGAAGFLAGLADFPIWLTLKMKMLFEIASIYGFDVKNYKERIYISIFSTLFPARKTETVFSKYLKTGRTKHKNFPGILMSSDGEISTGGSRLSGLG
jgi:hypothetical protein